MKTSETRFHGLRKILHRTSLSREDFAKSVHIREGSVSPNLGKTLKFWTVFFKFGKFR